MVQLPYSHANLVFPKQFTVGVLNATLDLAALVLVGVVGFLVSEVVLSPVVSGCLPSCGGWVLVGVAASRAKTFRNQNHRFQSKFAYCKLFGVYAGVIFWPPHLIFGILGMCWILPFQRKKRQGIWSHSISAPQLPVKPPPESSDGSDEMMTCLPDVKILHKIQRDLGSKRKRPCFSPFCVFLYNHISFHESYCDPYLQTQLDGWSRLLVGDRWL